MHVDVRYFAAAREATGLDGETLEIRAGSSVADLFEVLGARHPELAASAHALRFAVDESFVQKRHVLQDGATVALIPPVGGG